MARSKAQKGKRSRNRSNFDYTARIMGAPHAVKNCDLKGVTDKQYVRVARAWYRDTALEYSKRPAAYRPSYEAQIKQAGDDFYEGRQFRRKDVRPLVHIRTTTRLTTKAKLARKHYRKVAAMTGWTGKQVDAAFAKHFPGEWELVRRDVKK